MSLNRQQLCAALAISESTVRRLEHNGLPFTPVGTRSKRYDLDECKRWLDAQRRAPESQPAPALPASAFAEAAGLSNYQPPRVPMGRPALARLHAATRRVARIRRTPPWADAEAIRAIYRQAQQISEATGIPHHVDHEIPLQGALVSGLHVENNLQILTGPENSRKRNKFEVDA